MGDVRKSGSEAAAPGATREPRGGKRRRVLLLAALALIAAAGAGLWGARFRPVSVQGAIVASDVPVQVYGLGTVEARVSSQVGFPIPGVLVDLRADVGDHVAQGAVLARLDDGEQVAQVARARAAVEQADANLQKTAANVEKAQANYDNARSISERRQRLVETNTSSAETAETAKAAEAVAAADLDLARSDVLIAQASISDAKAQLQQQAVVLDFHTLAAPYDAMVTARLKELGSALNAGQPAFTLIDPKTIWVLAYIDESRAGGIKVGDPAGIVLRSHPRQRLAGKVARIQPESDRVNEERRIEVAFDEIPAYANLGEQAEVYITTARLPKALLVPQAAIVGLARDSGKVWTVEGGRLRRREVILGRRLLDGRYEITGGVPEGATVVTQLRSGLHVGRAARIEAGQTQ